ncbi:MAG: phosphoribosylamine--glycine ligase [Myxococcaceae bacterium]
MRVLVLGSGGREHALAWKLSQSPALEELLCAPGNPGTAKLGENVALRADDPVQVLALAQEREVELVVVGPEGPLVAGVADALATAKVPVFGPVAGAAAIEGSKAFAKEIMQAAGVPTADFQLFDQPGPAEAYARARGKVVVKADGLAAGKGVVVARDPDEAAAAVRQMFALGAAGKRLLLEEVLEGEEVSVIALCDGERYLLLPASQDHKRALDGDRGPNTGGMGAVTPLPFLDEQGLFAIGESVIAPTLAELRRRGLPFKGALYAGIMLTSDGPKVLEYNARFGDPETQVLMMQVEEDLLPVLDACARGALSQQRLRLHGGASVGVVLAASGYPAAARVGDPIDGLLEAEGLGQVFHAGTRKDGGRVVTAGGRVLTVCARAASLALARDGAYRAAEQVRFDGMQFRRDIGARALAATKPSPRP